MPPKRRNSRAADDPRPAKRKRAGSTSSTRSRPSVSSKKAKPEPKPKPTRQRNKKPTLAHDGSPLRTHPQLDKELRELAGILTVSKGAVKAIASPEGYKGGDIDRLAESPRSIGKAKFGDKYRDAFPGQDEPLSTSAVRELRTGFYETKGRSKADIEKGRILFENLSKRSRIPTHLVGFATDATKMQHPTSDPLALFADAKETASAHSRLDRERKQVAVEAGKKAAKEQGATFETVLNAMEAATYLFTSNWMAAPVTAGDIHENARRGAGIDVLELAPKIVPREEMKRKAAGMGVPVAKSARTETALESVERDWDIAGKNKRELSPERTIPKRSEPKTRVKLVKSGGTSPLAGRITKPTGTFPTVRTAAQAPATAVAGADDAFRGRTRNQASRAMQHAADMTDALADVI